MTVHIEFSNEDHVLVLFDWLARFNESDNGVEISDAEQRVLWDLEATLESSIGSILSGDYAQRVAIAHGRIVGSESDD